MKKLIIALSMVVGMLWSTTTPAQAEDRRPCVSVQEFRNTTDVSKPFKPTSAPAPSRRELERRWEVVGLGEMIDDHPPLSRGQELWSYPVCGYAYKQIWAWVYKKTQKVDGIALAKKYG
jgi:hypothetical protein